MAKRITEILIDDIDGTELTASTGETVQFSLDGVSYEIDLKTAHAEALRGGLAEYIAVARKLQGGSKAVKRGATKSSRDLSAVRGWLRAEGHAVSDRGRIPAELLEKYEAAH